VSDALSRAAILAASDIKDELVPIPEWGGSIRVRGLTAAEYDAFEMSLFDPKTGKRNYWNMRARLVVLAAIDDDRGQLFTGGDADAEALGAKSVGPVDRLYEVVQRLCARRPEDLKALEGNSGAGPGGTSASSSPSGSA
jgi:hypothetical protein